MAQDAEPARVDGTHLSSTPQWPDLAGSGRSLEGADLMRHRRVGSEELLIAALARGASYAEVGEIAGVSERTARRRAGDAEVAAAVRRLRTEAFEKATARLLGLQDAAVGTLQVLLASESEAIRLKAVGLVLDQARAMWELHNVTQRLSAVEATVGDSESRHQARWS